MHLRALIGQGLEEYTIQKLTEVYRVNVDGRKIKSIGFFQNPEVAKAFSQNQTDAAYHKTEEHLVLTNGEHGFLFDGEEITLLNDEEAALEIRKAALEKLSDAEKSILKL